MKRLYLLLLGVFVLFISLTSVSYAYTLDDVFTYASQLVGTPTMTQYPARQHELYQDGYNYLLRFEEQIRYRYNQSFSSANYFFVEYGQTDFEYGAQGVQVLIGFYSVSPTNIGHTTYTYSDGTFQRIWLSGGTFLGTMSLSRYGSFSYTITSTVSSGLTDLNPNAYTPNGPKGFYLIEDNEDYHENPGFQHYCINGIQFPSQYYFVSYYTNEIRFNEISGFCYRLPFSYNETYKKIGHIEGFEDLDRIHGNLSTPYHISGDEVYSDTIGAFQYNKGDGSLSKNIIFNELTGDVYIQTSCLYNKQAYIVSLSGMIGEDWIYIPLVDTELDPSYYAYFYTANVSNSGDNSIISNDYYQTLPPSLINFINNNDTTYDDVQKDNINYYLNQFFNGLSGDFVSGDIIGQLGYIDHTDNDFSLYIYTIYRNILDILVSSNTDSSLTFTLRGNTYTFNASDFAVPDGPLKSFVSLILTGGLLYLFYIQIHYYILNITTLDLFKALKGFEHEHTFYM